MHFSYKVHDHYWSLKKLVDIVLIWIWIWRWFCFEVILGLYLKANSKCSAHEDKGRWILKFIVLALLQIMNRISVVVAVSIAAYAIKQLTIRSWTSFFLPTTNCSGSVLFFFFFFFLVYFASSVKFMPFLILFYLFLFSLFT